MPLEGDIANGLNLYIAGNFVKRENKDVGIELGDYPGEINPYDLAGEHNGGLGEVAEGLQVLAQLSDNLLHEIGAEGQIDTLLVLGQGGDDPLLNLCVQGDDSELAVLTETPGDGTGEGATDVFRDHIQIPGDRQGIHSGFHDSHHILDGDPLPQKVAEDALQAGIGQKGGDSLLHQLGGGVLEVFYQPDGLTPIDELVGVPLDGLRQVSEHHGEGVYDGVAVDFGHLLILRQNPPGGDAVGGLYGLNAVNLTGGGCGLQGQEVIHQDFAPRHFLPTDFDDVLVGSKVRGVVQAYGRDDKAHILGILAAEDHNPVDEPAAPGLIHQGDQAVAEFHFNGLHREQGVDVVDVLVIVALAGGGCFQSTWGVGGGLFLQQGGGLFPGHTAIDNKAHGKQHHGDNDKGHMGGVGHDRQENQNDAGGGDGPGLGLKLTDHIGVEAVIGDRTGDDHARGRGDEYGREEGNQAVAHGGGGIGDDDLIRGHTAEHTDDESGHAVNDRDDDAHDSIALDDLGGAVHSAVEVRLLLDLMAAILCLLFVDEARGKVCVNGHLLAGHGIQREAGSHLGYTLGAFGDDDEVHQNDDEEDEDTHHNVAAGDELAKGLDDLTGVAVVAQDQPGGGHIHTQSEEGGHQE